MNNSDCINSRSLPFYLLCIEVFKEKKRFIFYINLGDTVPDVDRCFRCTCTNNNGQLDCVSICEYGDCYGKWVKPKGDECCDTCEPTSGCSYNGKEYGIGKSKLSH